jgi:hypothetical protein
VRVRLPAKYLQPVVTNPNPKQLTLRSIKFGITGSLNDRNCGYSQDDGLMMYTFACNTRREAVIVEDILKHKFADMTLFGSREYVDTARIAEFFDVSSYNPEDYASYIEVARKLFMFAVRWIKTVDPKAYQEEYSGKAYTIVERGGKIEFDTMPV